MQRFLEGLTATYSGDGFVKAAEAGRVTLYTESRGSPLNVGKELSAVHPVVRTHPVTGWKTVFAIGPFPKYINELTAEESEDVLKKLHSTIINNHDLQVRFKWKSPNDIGECFTSLECSNVDTDIPGQRSGITVASFTLQHLTMTG